MKESARPTTTLRKGSCLLGLCALALLRCSMGPTQVAGGSDTEVVGSMVSGAVRDHWGNRVSSAVVRLRSTDYVRLDDNLPLAGYANTVTDSSGAFVFSKIGSGSYAIEVNDRESTAVRLSCSIIREGDTVDFGVRTLEPYASIRGTIVPQSSTGPTVVLIQGLDRRSSVNALTGEYAVTDLPAGAYTVQVVAESPDYGTLQIATDSLAPSGTVDLPAFALPQFDTEDYAAWPDSARIRINTSAAGAGITEDVSGFPLLVRLDGSIPGFTFSTNGSDLRFASSSGTRLRYQLDWWDAAARHGGVWVLVDTIHGDNSTQSITMYWGKPNAPSFSKGTAVFDSTSGYRGVWHLGGSSPLTDASPYLHKSYNGGARLSEGILGGAIVFDGASYVRINDVTALEPTSLTLSCWILRDGPQVDFAKIIHKGKLDARPWPSYTLEFGARDYQAGFQTAKINATYNRVTATDSVHSDMWTHLTASFDAVSGVGEFFVNGTSQGTFTDTLPIEYYTDRPFPLFFGGPSSLPQRIAGTLDEIRIEAVPRSAAWVKLSYENQRQDGTVVEVQ